MKSPSDIETAAARVSPPPAAHAAGRFVQQFRPVIADLETDARQLQILLVEQPHDRAGILRQVDALKAKAMALFGAAVTTSRTIKDGR